jgi:hypothetical protein
VNKNEWIIGLDPQRRLPEVDLDNREALLARERNIAIQPMTQYLEEKEGLNQIAANHAADVVSQFVLRVGYLKTYPEPVSLRRPVNWFVGS